MVAVQFCADCTLVETESDQKCTEMDSREEQVCALAPNTTKCLQTVNTVTTKGCDSSRRLLATTEDYRYQVTFHADDVLDINVCNELPDVKDCQYGTMQRNDAIFVADPTFTGSDDSSDSSDGMWEETCNWWRLPCWLLFLLVCLILCLCLCCLIWLCLKLKSANSSSSDESQSTGDIERKDTVVVTVDQWIEDSDQSQEWAQDRDTQSVSDSIQWSEFPVSVRESDQEETQESSVQKDVPAVLKFGV